MSSATTIETSLRTLLPPQLHSEAAGLARLLAEVAAEPSLSATVQTRLAAEPALGRVLRTLAGRQVEAQGTLLTFGAGNHMGNISIGDVAGRDIVKLTVSVQAADRHDVYGLPNPYLGLRAFTYADRNAFAGRERLVAHTLRLLTAPGEQRTLLFVTGASGSGKSSFSQAGLIPAIEAYYQQRGQNIRYAVCRPARRPISAFCDALAQLGQTAGAADEADAALRLLSACAWPDGVNVLIIDQFEELFSQAEPRQRDEFCRLLAALPPFELLRAHIIATLRSDYLPELFAYQALFDCSKQGVELRAMNEDELKSAIQRPLHEARPYNDKAFEAALLDKLARDTAQDAAYLPLLQVTLEDLWRRGSLTLAAYGSLGDAIRQRAEDVYTYADYDGAQAAARNDAERSALMHLFLDLVEVSLDDDARRDVRHRRMSDELERADPQRARLIDDLCAARLLRKDSASDSGVEHEYVDIIHETLLHNWGRLRAAVEEQRLALQQRVRFEQALREWEAYARADAYALVGGRLHEAEALRDRNDIALQTAAARAFLARSMTLREAEREHELAQTRALMEAAHKRADAERRARQRAQLLVVFLGSIVLVGAVYFGHREWQRRMARREGEPLPIPGLSLAFERSEVSNARYARCVAVGRCAAPAPNSNPAFFTTEGGTQAVTGVDGVQAATFCAWIGRRLPTLSEWSYASGQTPRPDWLPEIFAALVQQANYLPPGPNSVGHILPASNPASRTPDGLQDMLGNVAEWTRTVWLVPENQRGPEWNGDRAHPPERLALAGGSFNSTADIARLANHFSLIDVRRNDIGFRCVEE